MGNGGASLYGTGNSDAMNFKWPSNRTLHLVGQLAVISLLQFTDYTPVGNIQAPTAPQTPVALARRSILDSLDSAAAPTLFFRQPTGCEIRLNQP